MARNFNGEELKTITVAELIELLQDQEPNAKVIFSTNYGDYCRTLQALPLSGNTEQVMIQKSAYSNSGFALSSGDQEIDAINDAIDNDEIYLLLS